jgi:hypothetical protein
MMRQPAATVKKAIDPDGANQDNRGINAGFRFQKSESTRPQDDCSIRLHLRRSDRARLAGERNQAEHHGRIHQQWIENLLSIS